MSAEEKSKGFDQPTTETWKPVVGYEGWYEVSDKGRLRRIKVYNSTRKGGIVRPFSSKNGYYRIYLWMNNKSKRFTVHQLVAAAFIGPCPDGYQVNHIDGIKTNNTPENLEYLSSKDHHDTTKKMGLISTGEQHPRAKLTEAEVRKIRAEYIPGTVTQVSLAKEFNVSKAAINHVIKRYNWKHID